MLPAPPTPLPLLATPFIIIVDIMKLGLAFLKVEHELRLPFWS